VSTDLWLRIDDPIDGAHVVCLLDEGVIGRDLQCDVVIHDDEASRQHARITPIADHRWQIRDLDTTNGTFVNSERIVGPAEISIGDVIRVGRVTCAIVSPDTR
jgi:SARP family transcriptional regulator, regulator of embCAB operon